MHFSSNYQSLKLDLKKKLFDAKNVYLRMKYLLFVFSQLMFRSPLDDFYSKVTESNCFWWKSKNKLFYHCFILSLFYIKIITCTATCFKTGSKCTHNINEYILLNTIAHNHYLWPYIISLVTNYYFSYIHQHFFLRSNNNNKDNDSECTLLITCSVVNHILPVKREIQK